MVASPLRVVHLSLRLVAVMLRVRPAPARRVPVARVLAITRMPLLRACPVRVVPAMLVLVLAHRVRVVPATLVLVPARRVRAALATLVLVLARRVRARRAPAVTGPTRA